MRIRISDSSVEYYTRAQRTHTVVRVQARDWYVIGVTADTVSGQQQWWVELSEV